jgi:hypothetical protein
MKKSSLKMAAMAALLTLPLNVAAENVPAEVKQAIPDAEKVGSGRLNYLFFDIYDATLFAPEGTYEKGEPVALQLNYLRSLDSKELVDETMGQFDKNGYKDSPNRAKWQETLERLSQPVKPGTKVTGVYHADGTSQFYQNGQPTGKVTDVAFNDAFFGLWLKNPPAVPMKLHQQLLGKQVDKADNAPPSKRR